MTGLLDLKLLFVTGKGGVGKTTVAPALALLASQRGKRVLICEVDAKGDVAALYEAQPTRLHREGAPARAVRHVHGHRGIACGST